MTLDNPRSWLAWAGPFAVFMALLVIMPMLDIAQPWDALIRVIIIVASLFIFSRRVIDFRAPHWIGSVILGIAVFALWIAPDMLFGPGYRSHWLFENSITGGLKSSLDPAERAMPLVLVLRSIRAIILVPILEELFWRGFLPRWLQNQDFTEVPLGRYTMFAFIATAILFASEHGPYWEVGLLTGLVYNWWMMRTRSLGDLILTHAVTNACLSGFVVATGRWEYWL
jgi:uncharacterized protein